jgi:hypothetical protein
MPTDKIDIVLVPQLLRIRRLIPDQTQSRDAATFLVDCDNRFDFAQAAQIIDQFAQLSRTLDVTREQNKAAGLHSAKQISGFRVKFLSGNASED